MHFVRRYPRNYVCLELGEARDLGEEVCNVHRLGTAQRHLAEGREAPCEHVKFLALITISTYLTRAISMYVVVALGEEDEGPRRGPASLGGLLDHVHDAPALEDRECVLERLERARLVVRNDALVVHLRAVTSPSENDASRDTVSASHCMRRTRSLGDIPSPDLSTSKLVTATQ